MTPTEVVERFLAAPPVGGALDAFTAVDAANVRSQAAAATSRLADGSTLGPLDGRLVGVKDTHVVDGYRARAGTGFLAAGDVAEGTVLRRLRATGAVVAGVNRATELGLSPLGPNPAGGTPRNPHDPTRITGGSSSGGAVAVAAGLVDWAVGTDYGGSVRIPPALCGVYGFKPTFGVVPENGLVPIGCWSLNVTGPIARTAATLARAFAVLADRPAVAANGPAPVVGVDWRWWARPDPEVDRPCRDVVSVLDPTPVTIGPALLDLARPATYATIGVEVAAATIDHPLRRFSPDVATTLAAARALPGVDYLRAQQLRTLLADAFERVFQLVDVLVTPTTACVAQPVPRGAGRSGVLDEALLRRVTAYVFPANLVGLPAATVPVGTTDDGLPIGLQIVGRRGDDDTVLRLVGILEAGGAVSAPRPAGWSGAGIDANAASDTR